VMETTFRARLCWDTIVTTDHNHVAHERHGERQLWVHRKGAMPAGLGEGGVLPGSMGSPSFHVEGRGHEQALCSSAHGAGRELSRTVARKKVTERELRRQMEGIWYDFRLANRLRDEAPAAYKDIRAVLRAQRDLVKVTRVLRPVLNYKGV
jgi:tRNA-splicing ligase RtcB (3'-phosphate/5'-hydroxy nucleic acid ligase)